MRRCDSASHEPGDLAQGRVVEQVADVQLTRVFLLDREHDFGQRQRAYPDFEQIVVRPDDPVLGKLAANLFQLGDQRIVVELVLFHIARRHVDYQVRIFTVEVRIQEVHALHLTARCLRDLRHWYDVINLEAGVFSNDVTHLLGQWYKRLQVLSEQYEHQQLLGLFTGRVRSRNDCLAEVQSVDLSNDLFDIVRIVVLAVDDDDVFLSAGDDELVVDEDSAITGA